MGVHACHMTTFWGTEPHCLSGPDWRRGHGHVFVMVSHVQRRQQQRQQDIHLVRFPAPSFRPGAFIYSGQLSRARPPLNPLQHRPSLLPALAHLALSAAHRRGWTVDHIVQTHHHPQHWPRGEAYHSRPGCYGAEVYLSRFYSVMVSVQEEIFFISCTTFAVPLFA